MPRRRRRRVELTARDVTCVTVGCACETRPTSRRYAVANVASCVDQRDARLAYSVGLPARLFTCTLLATALHSDSGEDNAIGRVRSSFCFHCSFVALEAITFDLDILHISSYTTKAVIATMMS